MMENTEGYLVWLYITGQSYEKSIEINIDFIQLCIIQISG